MQRLHTRASGRISSPIFCFPFPAARRKRSTANPRRGWDRRVFVARARTDFLVCQNPGGAAHTPFPLSPSESSSPKNFLGSAFLSHPPFPHPPVKNSKEESSFIDRFPCFTHNTAGISPSPGSPIQRTEILISTLLLLIAKTLGPRETFPDSRSRSPSWFPCDKPPRSFTTNFFVAPLPDRITRVRRDLDRPAATGSQASIRQAFISVLATRRI